MRNILYWLVTEKMKRPVVFAVTNKAVLSSYSNCMELKLVVGVTTLFNGGRAVSL